MIDKKWKYFTISSQFELKKGKRLTKEDMVPGNIPFIGAIDSNNGQTANIANDAIHAGNTISVTYNGSVAEAFYQPVPYWASDDVNVLYPKFPMTRNIALFICTIIRKEKYRFNYGRKWHLDRMRDTRLLLPSMADGQPDLDFMERFVQRLSDKEVSEDNISLSKPVLIAELKIRTNNWKKFKYGGDRGIFIIKNGYYNKKPDHTEEGRIPFIGATEFNNGVTEYYSLYDIENSNKDENSANHELETKIFTGNCVTVTNNGSVGFAFYQQEDFTCSHDVNVLYLKDRPWNKYIAMFICTLIQLEQYRWAYGRKWRPSRMPLSEIKLPVDKNDRPDWNFMEQYIKSLSYSASL